MESNKDTEFILSVDPRKIPFQHYQKDFTFVVNGKEYQTSRYIADLLSPQICQYHFTDETINSFNISVDLQDDKCDFTEILSLISFEKKPIKNENLDFYIKIFMSLGNDQALTELVPKNPIDITLTNVFEIIQNKQKYFFLNQTNSKFTNEVIQRETDFIACHFYEIDHEELQKLDISIIEDIIRNEKLQLKDEDSFMHFIIDLYSKNSKLSYLFENVHFLNISNEELENFYENFDLNDINSSIWNMIINRSINSIVSNDQISSQLSERYHFHECHYSRGGVFNGIIKYLTDKAGGNIHDKGIIEVSTNCPNYDKPPKNLLDFNCKNYFEADGRNAWIKFDFKNMKVKLEKYSIKSYSAGVDQFHLKNWLIEISNDNENWITIDKHSNCHTLNGNGLVGTFDVQPNNFSRFVRLRQTGGLWGEGYMWLHEIEFYGYLQGY